MIYRYAGLAIDTASRLVTAGSEPLDVPRRVFDCLALLIEHRDRAVGRDELMRHVWKRNNVSDTQLAQTILLVRRLLRDDGMEQRAIRTVPGFGYHFVGALEFVDAMTVPTVQPEEISPPSPRANDPVPSDILAIAAARPARAVRPSLQSHLPRVVMFSAIAVLVACVTMAAMRGGSPPVATEEASGGTPRVVVLPVTVPGAENMAWARLGLMDLLAARLRQQGLVVPPSENVIAATVNVDYAAKHLFGHALLVQASAIRLASGWEVALDATRENGLPIHVSGRHAEIVAAAEQASDSLLLALGRTPTAGGGHPSEAMQRIRAALLGNELDTLRELLARLPAAERDSVDARYLSAELDYRIGRLEESRVALDRLLDDGKESTNPPLRSRMLVARGSLFLRLHDDVSAERDFSRAVAVLEGVSAPRELGRALMGRACIAMRGEHDAAARSDLVRARMLLEAAGDDVSVARTDVNLAIIERKAGRPLEALVHLEVAAQRFETYAAVNELSVALANIADVQRSQLRWEAAQATSERAAALLPRLPDPHLRTRLQRARAEVLLGLGKLREAAAVLAELQGGDEAAGPADRAANRLLAGESAMLQGDVTTAASVADAALAFAATRGDDKDSRDLAAAAWLLRMRAAVAQRTTLPLTIPSAVSPTDASSVAQLAHGLWLHLHRNDKAAEVAMHAALVAAQADNNALQIRDSVDALASLLLESGRHAEALDVAANVAAYATIDFDSAVIVARMQPDGSSGESGRNARVRATVLAGERRVPPDLMAISTTLHLRQ